MLFENKYLLKAISKSGYVIIVKEYSPDDGKFTLRYISPNAAIIGMNPEMVTKGLKLTDDYIYPEDRDKVKAVIHDAIETKVKDYAHSYRMVGDNAEIFDVINEVSISEGKDGNIILEYYISKKEDKKDKKKKHDGLGKKHKKAANLEEGFELIKNDEKLEDALRAFSDIAGLYSAYIGLDGKMIYNPTGPDANLGVFYDLFENPKYHENFNILKEEIIETEEPTVRAMSISNKGNVMAAPIRMNNKINAIWIVAAFSDEENERLKAYFQNFCDVAEFISDYVEKKLAAEIEIAKTKGVGAKLREELAGQNIMTNALSKINSNLYNSVNEVIEETLGEVCNHLNLGEAFVYTRSKHNVKEYKIRNYFNITGRQPDSDLLETLSGNMYIVEQNIKNGGGIHLVDNANYTRESKLSIMRYNLKAVVAYPIYLKGKLNGVVFFAEDRNERVFSKEDLRFLKSISLIIQNMIENAVGDDNIRNVNKHLIETYNNFDVGVFVRDTYSGEVLFANKKMNELVGCDFLGMDSRMLINDLHDRFDSISTMRKPFIDKEKVTNWRSYIEKLDQIMDITEIKMEWLDGEPASLIILRKANDL
ncbi:MAG: GAF domain-containing protein [Lachnospiraceae bacterium]|nr:GAF domain-containing protein [Lachnospiraceae bacterium]